MKQKIRSGLRTRTVLGKSVEVLVEVYAHPDLEPLADTFEDLEEIQRKIDSGEIDLVNLFVSVSFGPFTGIDTLGQVFVSTPEDLNQTIEDHAMEQNAIQDLENVIRNAWKYLIEFKEVKS